MLHRGEPVLTVTIHRDALARAILADRERLSDEDTGPVLTEGSPTLCFACRRSFMYHLDPADGRNVRFCSWRCQNAYDDPGIVYSDPVIRYTYRDERRMMPRGAGFAHRCLGCGHEFVSKGLRCCSPACEAKHRRKEELATELSTLGVRVDTKRRKCEGCGALIPRFRKGKAVSKTVRFCSAKCSQRARRNAKMAPDSLPGVSTPNSCEKSPFYGLPCEPAETPSTSVSPAEVAE